MEILICGVVYGVIYESGSDFEKWGEINHTRCEIRLKKDLDKQCQAVTFIEEIIHGILVQTGFQGEHDEHLIGSVANGLFQCGISMDSFDLIETPPESDGKGA